MAEIAAPLARPSKWIISPAADLALLVATPLAIVPAVALVNRQVSAEVIFLYVAAFASIGHHLPGYLRAYGDRELFQRFRWRFLLAPPIALGAALAFSWSGLQGLELLLLFWATWHILMQTYGFMRIYDMKTGAADAVGAWLDFLLCLAIFAAGIVFSQSRVLGILEALSLTGLPLPPSHWLWVLQTTVGVVAGIVLALSIAYAVRQGVRGSINPIKWLLVLSTAWLYWICGSLSTNLLVGVAMFEIFHALQYYAIVWSFNHRRARLAGDQLGPLRVLFGDAWWCLLLYAAAIAAFGSVRLMSDGVADASLQKFLLALLAASTMLHFYYDGFIWKVRERATQVNLGIDTSRTALAKNFSLPHAVRWAMLLIGVALLYGIESRTSAAPRSTSDQQTLAQLAAWTPELPDMQVRMSAAALDRGETALALAQARRAAATQPRSHAAHEALAAAYMKSGDYAQAANHFQQAITLGPRRWENHFELAQAFAQQQKLPEALAALAVADRLQPQSSTIHFTWGEALARSGNTTAALDHFRQALNYSTDRGVSRGAIISAMSAAGLHDEAIAIAANEAAHDNTSAAAQLAWGRALFADGQYDKALPVFQAAIKLAPNSAAAHYELGATQLQLGKLSAAREALQRAIKINDRHGQAYFQLGNAYYMEGDAEHAAQAYRRAAKLLPKFPGVHNNYGALLFELGELAAAEESYRTALALQPDRADAHYNLALVLLRQGKRGPAREHAQQASELGLAPSDEVAQELGL